MEKYKKRNIFHLTNSLRQAYHVRQIEHIACRREIFVRGKHTMLGK